MELIVVFAIVILYGFWSGVEIAIIKSAHKKQILELEQIIEELRKGEKQDNG